MSEEMNDYGHLYKGELFKKLFPHFSDHQKEAAKALSRRILGRCGVDIGMPHIDWIIDLGCGDGTLTIELAKLTNKAVQFIGIDCSADAIRQASQRGAEMANVSFQASNGSFADLFATLKNGDKLVDWKRAALVCLSHTWLHLDQNDILEAVKKHRPALLVIDFFHTWDSAVTRLSGGHTSEVLEFGRSLNDAGTPNCNGTYWLKTVPSKTAGKVTRGLWKEVAISAAEPVSNGKWQFETDQHALTTGYLLGEPPKDGETCSLEDAHKQGTITSESGCDYIVRKQIRHPSGWGEMHTYALVPRDDWAKHVNQSYFEVVKKIVSHLFVSPASKGRYDNLWDLLKLYNVTNTSESSIEINNNRAAMITLPFDPHTNFARIVGLSAKCGDEKISKYDLILEMPSDEQIRFPTAYSLFHTSEGRTSSPQAFPLEWAPDYDSSWVDKEFAKLENRLLGLTDADDSKIKQDKEIGFFLLPVYFGSLPLFTLVLRFPAVFPPQSTEFQVYFSALANLHSEIKVALDDDFIRTDLLCPWIAASLDALDACKKEMSLPEKVNILENMLFGSIAKVEGPRNYKAAGIMRDGGVLGKDWKSWILGIPSYPIKKLRSVEAENTRLWNLWEQEKKRVLLDPDLLISSWFQAGDFFSPLDGTDDGPHDNWECKTHLPRLRRMFELVGVECTAQSSPVDDSWLQAALSELSKEIAKEEKVDAKGYFGGAHTHFLFKWMMAQFDLLVFTKDSCQSGIQCYPKAVADKKDCSRNEVFLRLKSVFCKSLGNTGERVRFGLQRLHCLLSAATPSPSILEGLTTYNPLVTNALESRFWSDDDPSRCISEFVFALGSLKKSTVSILEKVKIDPAHTGTGVSISISTRLSSNGGGTECDRVRRAFSDLEKLCEDKVLTICPPSWTDTSQFTLKFSVTGIETGITFNTPQP